MENFLADRLAYMSFSFVSFSFDWCCWFRFAYCFFKASICVSSVTTLARDSSYCNERDENLPRTERSYMMFECFELVSFGGQGHLQFSHRHTVISRFPFVVPLRFAQEFLQLKAPRRLAGSNRTDERTNLFDFVIRFLFQNDILRFQFVDRSFQLVVFVLSRTFVAKTNDRESN